MLIPTDDQTLTAMMENYDELKNLVHVACPPPHITRQVLNKSETLSIAGRCGIRVPNSTVISNSAQLFDLVGSFAFPWILKPAEKETRVEETKSISFENAGQVELKFPSPREFAPPMLLQEYCAGAGVGVEMLMHEGNCVAVFQHRRLKELPFTGGVSVLAISERPDAALVETSLALLRALEWSGVAMVEYKVNPKTGPVLMEVNGRYWGTISLAVSSGIDFPWYQWQLVHGEQPEMPRTYTAGKKWRWTIGYLDRLYCLAPAARHTAANLGALRDTLLQVYEDFGPRVFHATFSLSDPMPSAIAFVRALKYFVSDGLTRLLQAVVRRSRWRIRKAMSQTSSANAPKVHSEPPPS